MKMFIIFIAEYFYLIIIATALFGFVKVEKLKKRNVLVLSIFTFFLSFLASRILSYFIQNPRPFVVDSSITPFFDHIPNNGFPSDHALLVMTVAFTVFVFNRKLGIILAFGGLMVGVARTVAQVHHMVDILGSIIIAFSSCLISYIILKNKS